ncbi:unnamed protein product [Calypogeia fissa]
MSTSGAPIFDGTQGDRRYKPDTRKRARISAVATTAEAASDADASRKQEFRQILEEVQKLGTSQLSWKERKELELKKIVALGAKPAKSFKMPISMGLTIKRKREKLEAEKVEQDILSGFLPAKRKKKTAPRDSSDDKGLRLSEGKFKGGVLYVQKPEAKAAVGEKRGRDRALDRVFNEGGSKRAGGKSKRGKGKKGGKKGGKRKR